jgi:hypothetical protein
MDFLILTLRNHKPDAAVNNQDAVNVTANALSLEYSAKRDAVAATAEIEIIREALARLWNNDRT